MKHLLLLLCLVPSFAWAKKKPSSPCSSYFMMIEQDAETVNLKLTGMNRPQQSWYRKHGNEKEYAGICFVSADESGRRIALTPQYSDTGYSDKIVGDAPSYLILWEEHLVFVPDNRGGHEAYSANGTLSLISSKGNPVPIGPIHNTNITIFSSPSTSLLKSAIREIAEQGKQ